MFSCHPDNRLLLILRKISDTPLLLRPLIFPLCKYLNLWHVKQILFVYVRPYTISQSSFDVQGVTAKSWLIHFFIGWKLRHQDSDWFM